MKVKIEKTFKATIYLGLKRMSTMEQQSKEKLYIMCQDYVDEKGECLNIVDRKYIYTSGSEDGVSIEFIQYPRFPREESVIVERALELAEKLMIAYNQYNCSVIANGRTFLLENKKIKRK